MTNGKHWRYTCKQERDATVRIVYSTNTFYCVYNTVLLLFVAMRFSRFAQSFVCIIYKFGYVDASRGRSVNQRY